MVVLWWYLGITGLAMAVVGCTASIFWAAAETDWEEDEARRLARICVTVPLWPVFGVIYVYRSWKHVLKEFLDG